MSGKLLQRHLKLLIGMIGLLTSQIALSTEYSLLEPRKASVDIYEYQALRDPYIYPEDTNIKYGGTFNLDMNILRINDYKFYWENGLFFDQSQRDGKVKHAGWHYKFGLTLFKGKTATVEAFKEHQSRHVFDQTREMPFPFYDRAGVSIIFWEK